MKLLKITDIEYNALRAENTALKEKVVYYQNKLAKLRERQQRVIKLTGKIPSASAVKKNTLSIINDISKMITSVQLQLDDAKSMESYYEARYVEEMKKSERTAAFDSIRQNRVIYANIVRQLTAEINLLKQSKANFEEQLKFYEDGE